MTFHCRTKQQVLVTVITLFELHQIMNRKSYQRYQKKRFRLCCNRKIRLKLLHCCIDFINSYFVKNSN